jgi:hypothetical protein
VQAPLAVTVEVRALDVGPRILRAFRVTRGISEDGLSLDLELPFEAGRPVSVELSLPGEAQPLRATGVVADTRPETDTDEPCPCGVTFTTIDPGARQRVARYVEERLSTWPK